MKIKIGTGLVFAALACMLLFSCKNGKSYIELRKEEDNAINKYLSSDGRTTASLPADGNFLTRENSENPPFYILPDGVYMQIVKMGYREPSGTFFRPGDRVYFRFERMSLTLWATGVDDRWGGNWSDSSGASDTYFFDYTTQEGPNSSQYYQYGLGIEYPLRYVGNGAILNLIVPSKMGFASEISNVIPYLFKIRYNLKEN